MKHVLLRGFMLVEVALVLAVIAIILTPILHLLAAQREKNAVLDQLRARQSIVEAVEGFVLATGRLPCPATQAQAVESREGDRCTHKDGWIPQATLGVQGMSGKWKMAFATLEQAGEPAQHALVSSKPFAKLSPQQLAEIVLAPISINRPLGEGPLPAIHLCQIVSTQSLPHLTEPGCGLHSLLSATAVWVAYPVSDVNNNRFQQFFINPDTPVLNPVWISFERMNWLWMKRGALDPLHTGE